MTERTPHLFKTLVFLFALSVALTLYTTAPQLARAQSDRVEVFDVKRGRVVHEFIHTPEIRTETELWVASITGVVPSLNPLPEEGIILGIPMSPPLPVYNQWVQLDSISMLFLFVNRLTTDQPVLLLINNQNQALFVHIKFDIQPFIDKYNLRKWL
jgi:hypothetical protein